MMHHICFGKTAHRDLRWGLAATPFPYLDPSKPWPDNSNLALVAGLAIGLANGSVQYCDSKQLDTAARNQGLATNLLVVP